MQKIARKLSLAIVALFTVFTALSYMPANAAVVVPKVQYVSAPQTEYTAGDRVQFNLNAPNYGGRVQYRVVLWDNNNKQMRDLWTAGDRYYTNWQPYGNETFTLGWPISEPGTYRITIYAKRAGLANSKTALKGYNCDSYMESVAFTVKAKEAPAATVSSIASLADVNVDQFKAAVLPTTVTLNMSDNTTKAANVTWPAVDTTKAGTVALEGTVAGTTLKAKVNVVVKAVAPAVSELTAVNSTTLGVKFNRELTADEKAKAVFAFKLNNNAIVLSAPVWEGTVAKFTRPDSAKLVAGTYAVSVTGLTDAALTASKDVAAEKAVSMVITTDRVKVGTIGAQSLGYKVLNQYGEEMTVAAGSITVSTYNVTNNARAISGSLLNALTFDSANLNDVIRITAYLSADPTVNTVKDVTVGNITVGSVSIGAPILPTGVTRLTTGTASVEFPLTVTDDKGASIKLAADASISSGDVQDGVILNYTGISAVAINSNGNLTATLGAPGTASIQFINPATGAIVTKAITIVKAPDTAVIAMTQPATPVRLGATSKIPFTLVDQFGDAMKVTDAGWSTADVNLTSSNPAVATVSWVGNDIVVNPVSKGTATIYANVLTTVANPSTAVATLTVTVIDAKQATNVAVSGTPAVSLANGQTVLGSATTGALKFAVTDQDGNPIDLAATTVAGVKLNITKTDVNSVLTAPSAGVLMAGDMSSTVGTTNGITVVADAANKGTASITAQLFNDANGNDAMDAGEALASFVTVNYTVAAPVLTKGKVSSIIANGTATVVANADVTAAYSNYSTGDGAVKFVYSLLDQAGNAFTTTTAQDVVWTITNTGDAAITVNDGTAKTLAKGQTATYTTISTVGAASTASIVVIGADANKVVVSAKASGVAQAAAATLYFTESAAAAGTTFNGKVVAIDTTGTWMVIETAVGNVVVDYTAGTEVLTVNGNTATQTQFEDNLSVGDTVKVSVDGSSNVTVELTNN